MKKLLMIMLILLAMVASLQAQDKLKVGEIKNGKLVITNLAALHAYFMNCLDNSGTLGKDFQVNASPDATRYVVYYPVFGNQDRISSVGVMLVAEKRDVHIVTNPPDYSPGGPGAGGSATITCTGNPCNSCYPDITWPAGKWFPLIICKCEDPGGICNMSVSFSININITY
jgi:hypothetical protein